MRLKNKDRGTRRVPVRTRVWFWMINGVTLFPWFLRLKPSCSLLQFWYWASCVSVTVYLLLLTLVLLVFLLL